MPQNTAYIYTAYIYITILKSTNSVQAPVMLDKKRNIK